MLQHSSRKKPKCARTRFCSRFTKPAALIGLPNNDETTETTMKGKVWTQAEFEEELQTAVLRERLIPEHRGYAL